MNKEEFLKELKEINQRKKNLINEYLCDNTKYINGTKFKDVNNNRYVIFDFSYDEKYKQIFYYLDDISKKSIIQMSEIVIDNNNWTQINNIR